MSADVLLAIIAGRDIEGYFEIRCRDPRTGRIAARHWLSLTDRKLVRRAIEAHSSRLDVYIGAAPRTRREGGKAAINHGWCLWADIDTAAGVERLRSFEPRPSLVVHSGTSGNVHAWWALTEPLRAPWIERANRRLALHLGADMKAVDIARILRVPGTWNRKTDPPAAVTVESVSGSVTTVMAAVNRLPDPPAKPPVKRPLRGDLYTADPLLGISSDRYYAVLTGRPVTRGNVCCPFPAHRGGTEKSPSMRLYDGGTFFCFGCGVGGSIFQFAAHLWNTGTRGDDFRALRTRLTEVLG